MAVVLENIWSDGESKSKTADQAVPFAGDWSDGVSIVGVVYSATGTTYYKSISGALSFAGAISESWHTKQALTGSITPAGSLDSNITFRESLSGAITPAGSIIKKIGKNLTGALSLSGSPTKKTGKNLSGNLSLSGDLNEAWQTKESISGALSFIGNLAAQIVELTAKRIRKMLNFFGMIGR